MVIDALDQPTAEATWRSLAALMQIDGGLTEESRRFIAEHTLIRKLESQFADTDRVPWNRKITLQPTNGALHFKMAHRDLPQHLPDGWGIEKVDDKTVQVTVETGCEMFVRDHRELLLAHEEDLPLVQEEGPLLVQEEDLLLV